MLLTYHPRVFRTTSDDWSTEREALQRELETYATLYARRPFNNRSGLRGVSAFALFWFLRRLEPDIVFEVGVWKGFSTWLIEQAAPQARLHCFDPMFFLSGYMSRWKIGRTYRSPRATYHGQEFSCAPIGDFIRGTSNAVAFFDDHQNKLARVAQCRAFGIRHIIFDDNLRQSYTHRTLEHERAAGEDLSTLIDRYEIFPALWDVDANLGGGLIIQEKGMGFPVAWRFRAIYDDRAFHSYVTYVRLRDVQPATAAR